MNVSVLDQFCTLHRRLATCSHSPRGISCRTGLGCRAEFATVAKRLVTGEFELKTNIFHIQLDFVSVVVLTRMHRECIENEHRYARSLSKLAVSVATKLLRKQTSFY